uniref:Uncharacterized protein n=1 Tax=Glossina austeni TaxID=7395 RepID=A0A1A9VAK3_GLOAU
MIGRIIQISPTIDHPLIDKISILCLRLIRQKIVRDEQNMILMHDITRKTFNSGHYNGSIRKLRAKCRWKSNYCLRSKEAYAAYGVGVSGSRKRHNELVIHRALREGRNDL